MTESEYAAYNKDFAKNKTRLLASGGKLNKRYSDKDFIYSDDMEKAKYAVIYYFDIHLEDLENGIAPESPGIFTGDAKINQRELDNLTMRGWK